MMGGHTPEKCEGGREDKKGSRRGRESRESRATQHEKQSEGMREASMQC